MNKNTVRRRKGVMKVFLDGVKTKVGKPIEKSTTGGRLL